MVTDESRVQHIVGNLLDNAIRWTPPGGLVRLEGRPRAGGGFTATVTDTGPGIAPAERERIFEAFHSSETPDGRRGSGLGAGGLVGGVDRGAGQRRPAEGDAEHQREREESSRDAHLHRHLVAGVAHGVAHGVVRHITADGQPAGAVVGDRGLDSFELLDLLAHRQLAVAAGHSGDRVVFLSVHTQAPILVVVASASHRTTPLGGSSTRVRSSCPDAKPPRERPPRGCELLNPAGVPGRISPMAPSATGSTPPRSASRDGAPKRGYSATKQQLASRLARIEGQVRGIERMVEDERYCIDILTQISAIQAALDKVALGLLDDHANTCVVGAEPGEQGERTEELMAAVARLMRRG